MPLTSRTLALKPQDTEEFPCITRSPTANYNRDLDREQLKWSSSKINWDQEFPGSVSALFFICVIVPSFPTGLEIGLYKEGEWDGRGDNDSENSEKVYSIQRWAITMTLLPQILNIYYLILQREVLLWNSWNHRYFALVIFIIDNPY